nr:putative reverse transcriptase domain-containing protein [Tanacetum cinerariifolium]
VMFSTCTLLDAALTWWNSQIRSLGSDAYSMTWEVLKKKMTDKYCPQGEIKKLEIELWNLKIDKYVSILPDNIYESVKASKPKTLDETIELANDLMDQKLRTYAERLMNNKRKADDSFKNNHGHQQQPLKRQNVAKISAKKEGDNSEGKKIKDVLIVQDFPEVFPEDLSGFPPARPVEFQIDLILGAAPVARVSYRLINPETTEKIVLIKQRIQAAQDRQKSYADLKRKTMEFEIRDRVMLKVSPWKGVVRFGKREKLNPRYVGPFKVLAKVGKVAYKLELPQELSRVHHTFHVSNLKKFYADEPLVMPLEGIHVDDKLSLWKSPLKSWSGRSND